MHANGWDKGPLLKLLRKTGKVTEEEMTAMIAQKATMEKTKVCFCANIYVQIVSTDINYLCPADLGASKERKRHQPAMQAF